MLATAVKSAAGVGSSDMTAFEIIAIAVILIAAGLFCAALFDTPDEDEINVWLDGDRSIWP